MECVKCVVTFSLKELHWEDPPGCPIHLEGPPVFLRACVLGQLQHSPLYRPTFPLHLHGLSLNFDRVFTNCSDPSLLKEIVTGEHVFLEMVQVTEDYDGGRILARYEAPANQFLFPKVPLRPGQLRTLTLSKSRKYQYCPQLTLSVSTAVTTLTMATPFPSSSPRQPPVGDPPKEALNPAHSARRPPRRVGVATKDKLRLLLDSYTEPCPEGGAEGSKRENFRRPPAKIRSPNLRSSSSENRERLKYSSGGRKFKARGTLAANPGGLYHCCTVNIGPHEWTSCPRRSFQQHNRGTRSRGTQRNPRSKSAPCLELAGGPENRNFDPSQVLPPRPFVAGGVDKSLLAKRDFCGQDLRRSVEKEGGEGGEGRGGERGWIRVNVITSREKERKFPSFPQYETKMDGGGKTLAQGSPAPPPNDIISNGSSGGGDESGARSPDSSSGSRSSCDSHVTGSGREEEGSSSHSDDDITSDYLSQDHDEMAVTHIISRRQRRDLLSKYLASQNGNGGMGMGTSPATLIEHKLQTLIQDCCECQRSADGLGQDNMSEDDERLRASLSAEREDLLNKSAKLMPDRSVLVRLGGEGGRDYWSQKMVQLQGKHHRLVFTETMEKIYCRLYQQAINIK